MAWRWNPGGGTLDGLSPTAASLDRWGGEEGLLLAGAVRAVQCCLKINGSFERKSRAAVFHFLSPGWSLSLSLSLLSFLVLRSPSFVGQVLLITVVVERWWMWM